MMTFNCPSNGWKYQFTGSSFLFLFPLVKTFCWRTERVASVGPSGSGAGGFSWAQRVWTVFPPAVIYQELFDHPGVSHDCRQLPTFCPSRKSKVSPRLNVQALCG